MLARFFARLRGTLGRADEWVNTRQVRWPTFLQVREDFTLLKRFLTRIFMLVVLFAVLGVCFWIAYWFFYVGPKPASSDPARQDMIPTAEPSPTAIVDTDPWKDVQWLSSADARSLRTAENVVNLAYLEAGGANYADGKSAVFDADSWQPGKPLGITALSVSGTAVSISAGGYDYHLNVYQPFVLSNTPTRVYCVDSQGKLWQTDLTPTLLVPLADAIAALPLTVSPNPELTFTY